MYSITKEIDVDYGHRVMTHGSKCKNIHGHRGTVEVTCQSTDLHDTGEQKDMVLDFSFLKQIMLDEIDTAIDHGFIASIDDIEILKMFAPAGITFDGWLEANRSFVKMQMGKHLTTHTNLSSKLYIVDFIPTAERLAEHFFYKLKPMVHEKSKGLAKIVNVRFWETATSVANYPGVRFVDAL